MFGHLHQNLKWNGCDVSACLCTVYDMDRVTDAGCDDLGLDVMHLIDLHDVVDQVDTWHGDIIQTTKEWGYISRAGPCCKQCLSGRKYQRYVGFDALSS